MTEDVLTKIKHITAQAEALAMRLEAGVSKRALAEAVATEAAVEGLIDGRTPAQLEADLMAKLRRYEVAAALRQSREMAEGIVDELREKGFSDREMAAGISNFVRRELERDVGQDGGVS